MADSAALLWIIIPLAVLLVLLALLVCLPIICRRYCATMWHDMLCYECCESTVFCMECCRACECDCGGSVTEDYPVDKGYKPVQQGGRPVIDQPSRIGTPNYTPQATVTHQQQQQRPPYPSWQTGQQPQPVSRPQSGMQLQPPPVEIQQRTEVPQVQQPQQQRLPSAMRYPMTSTLQNDVRSPAYGWQRDSGASIPLPPHLQKNETYTSTPPRRDTGNTGGFDLDQKVPLSERNFGKRPLPTYQSYEQPINRDTTAHRSSGEFNTPTTVISPTRMANIGRQPIYSDITPLRQAPDEPSDGMPLTAPSPDSGMPLAPTTALNTQMTQQHGRVGNMAWSLQQQVTVGGRNQGESSGNRTEFDKKEYNRVSAANQSSYGQVVRVTRHEEKRTIKTIPQD